MVMQTNPSPALVAADAAQAKDLPAESQGALAQVQPTGLYLGSDGAIDGAVDATFDQAAGAYAVMPVIRNYEGPIVRSDLLANMLVDNAQRAAHIDTLVNLAVGNHLQGRRHRLPRAGQESARRVQPVHQGAGREAACAGQRAERARRAGRAGGGRPLGDRPLRLADAGPAGRHGEDPCARRIPTRTSRMASSTPCCATPSARSTATSSRSVLSGQSIEQAGNYLLPRTIPTRSSRCWAAWPPTRRSSSRASR